MLALRLSFGRACLDTRLSPDIEREDLARRLGLTARYLAMIERGEANPTLGVVERIAEALGLELELLARPPVFPAGTRVKDAVHARCSAYVHRRLPTLGWEVAREVEIVHGRSHRWIDLLAFDPTTGTLLVIEIKTRLDDLGGLERQIAWMNGWHGRPLVVEDGGRRRWCRACWHSQATRWSGSSGPIGTSSLAPSRLERRTSSSRRSPRRPAHAGSG